MPLQIPDQSIAAQVPEPVDPMVRISQMLNIQGQRIQNSANQSNLDETNAYRNFAQSNAVKNDDGSPNIQKIAARAASVAPTQGADYVQRALGNQSTQIANNTNQMNYQSAQTNKVSQILTSLASNRDVMKADQDGNATPEGTRAILQAGRYASLSGVDPEHVDAVTAALIHTKPSGRPQLFSDLQRAAMDQESQRKDENPSLSMVDDGTHLIPFNQNSRSTSGGIGVMNLPPIPKQLPIGVQTIDSNGVPGYNTPANSSPPQPSQGIAPSYVPTTGMSAQPGGMQIAPAAQGAMNGSALSLLQQERANEKDPEQAKILDREIARAQTNVPQGSQPAAPGQRSFVASGLAPGVTKAIEGTQDVINKDYSSSSDRAAQAGKDMSILTNIKQYVPDAITGYGGDTRKVLAGLQSYIASKMQMDTSDFAKVKTDELSKNTNMLALAGGNTNLAKQLSEVANPNTTMDKPAIISTANQLIAVKKLDLAEFKFKDQFKGASAGHPELYTEAMKAFNEVNDPKVIEWGTMSPKERSDFKGSLSSSDQKSFGDKLEKARHLGIAPMAGTN